MSFIKIDKDEVYHLCSKKLKYIEEWREKNNRAMEENYLKQLNNNLIRKLFRRSKQTELTESDKKYLSHCNWHYPDEVTAGYTKDICNRLLKAAYTCKLKMMYLDTVDLDAIK